MWLVLLVLVERAGAIAGAPMCNSSRSDASAHIVDCSFLRLSSEALPVLSMETKELHLSANQLTSIGWISKYNLRCAPMNHA